jgi:hypothetical protein
LATWSKIRRMRTPLFGCPTCGHIGWSRLGERVDGAGEEDGTPMVRKQVLGTSSGGEWTGDCGHAVPPGSPLEQALDSVPSNGVGVLKPNRPEELDDWRPSATR